MSMDHLVTVCAGMDKVHLGVGDLPGSIEMSTHTGLCPKWCYAGSRFASRMVTDTPTVAKGAVTVDRDAVVPHTNCLVVPTHPAHQALVADWKHRRYAQDRAYLDTVDSREYVEAGRTIDTRVAEDGIRALLRLMGEDPLRTGLADTPARVVKAYLEMADRPDSVDVLLRQFEDGPKDGEMVTVRGIEFTSLCEHHLLPFTGTATIAYIPAGAKIVGLSKLPRLLHHYARRPQVQERLTGQVTKALDDHLDTNGAACRIEATHQCMSLRGVRAQVAAMVTTSLTGRFLENPATRAEFLAEGSR
jgi:GTP cyclohydrolase I